MTENRRASIFQIGDVLNNTYRVEAVLGRGGTSEVYRARSEISGHEVALKALRSEYSDNQDFVTLMTREEAIREVRHDAIVRYFHNQRTAEGVVFLVMDHVKGVGLDKKLKDGGMGAEDLLTIATRVAEGLEVAHAKNITHRDLSPDNIILRGGDPADAVIIDFGIAKDSNPGAETIVGNEFAGKYAYAAPEQLEGKTDARADIYALGALLLATYRGRTPDVGANPLEVIARKAQPLDTSGVPEPLKTVIDRMTVPDREGRIQNAGALLRLLRTGGEADDALDSEATRIVPLPSGAGTQTAARRAVSIPPAARPPVAGSVSTAAGSSGESRRGRGILFAVLGVLLLAGLGAGAWFGGFIGPGLPTADPFTLTISRSSSGGVSAEGYVPSQAIADALAGQVADLGGTADLSLAKGPIGDDWGPGVLGLVDLLAPLDEARLNIVNDTAEATGLTEDRQLFERLNAALAQPDVAPGLSVEAALELGPRFLEPSRVRDIADALADCGELTLQNPPSIAYEQGAKIVVIGRVASPETRRNLRDAISQIAGDRDVVVETEVLNRTLCTIDAVLPKAPSGGIDIAFSQGATGEATPSGRFFVGENPVIDVTIPADLLTGFLLVTALDVSGNVFQLLPNLNRQDHRIEDLRDGKTGPVTIRAAYSKAEAEAANGTKLALEVDDNGLGQSRVLVIVSDNDILNGLRPTTESAESFAQALLERQGAILSLDSRILTTTRR